MASAPLQQGTLLNERYNVLHALGQGGMGTVYKAEHVRLHAIVAIKEIRGLNADNAQHRQELDRCEHEARFLVNLNHPNLPKVTDAFIENDCFYLVMEYIEGVTLDARMSAAGGKPLDVMQCVDWGLQIADVLTYLHSQEPAIIFRDLKPSNVMALPSNNIKLIDFGIARHFQPGASKDTSLLGSVGYSPPEQFGRGQTDARSDVYALGATLHHLLTGRDPALQPFKFPPAHTFNPDVPRSLSNLLEMCLALDPDQRPASVSVVAARLLVARDELMATRNAAIAQAALLANTPALSLPNARAAQHDPPANGPKASGADQTANAPERPSVRVVTASTATTRSASSQSSRVGAASANTAGGAYPTPTQNVHARRSPALFLVPVLLAVIGGGIAFATLYGRGASQTGSEATVAPTVYVKPPALDYTARTDPNTASPDANAAPPAPVAPGPNTAATPATPVTPLPSGNIRLQSALLTVANDMLPIALSGTIQGQANTQLQLAVYFFDAKGQPIEAIDLSNVAYTNAQKYLCTYKTLSVLADTQTVQETLSVPARLLLNANRPTPYTYQVMLFQEGGAAPLYKSGMGELPPGAYGGANVSSQSTSSGSAPSVPHSVISPIHVGG